MFLFNKKKVEEYPYNENAKYKVLGTGCAKCTKLYNNLVDLKNDGLIDGDITKVDNPALIVKYGALTTPALVVDEKLIFAGESPDRNKLKSKLEII